MGGEVSALIFSLIAGAVLVLAVVGYHAATLGKDMEGY